jgi:hypothetical protein
MKYYSLAECNFVLLPLNRSIDWQQHNITRKKAVISVNRYIYIYIYID